MKNFRLLYELAKNGSKYNYKNCLKRVREETEELESALIHESKLDARIEAGDIAYYLIYYLFLICEKVDLNPLKVIEIASTKVASRRKVGKNKQLEKKLVSVIL
jgi:NTP pyrophosphatase (non-canonical NTP hydrolase)